MTGPNKIPAKYLKLCADEISSPLCYIINESIECQIFTSQWKLFKISTIPKISNPIEPSDYRPISNPFEGLRKGYYDAAGTSS